MKGRERENDRIPVQAVAVLMLMMLANVNFLLTPRIMATAAGRDSWIAGLLGIVLTGGVVWFLVRLARRFPRLTLVEIAQTVLGRPLGTAVGLVYIVLWLARAGWLVEVQSQFFRRTLLNETPEFALSAYVVVLSTYLAHHGIEPMVRLFLTFVGVYVAVITPVTFLSIREMEFARFLPVLENGVTPVLEAAWLMYSFSIGLEFVLMVHPHLLSRKKLLASAFTGLLMAGIPFYLILIILIGTFGEVGLSNFLLPVLSLVEAIELPGFTGFRVDPIFMVLWSLLVFAGVSTCQYLAISALRRLFGREGGLWPSLLTFAVLVVWLLVPKSLTDLRNWAETLIPVVVPVATLGIPFVLWLVAVARGVHDEEVHDETGD